MILFVYFFAAAQFVVVAVLFLVYVRFSNTTKIAFKHSKTCFSFCSVSFVFFASSNFLFVCPFAHSFANRTVSLKFSVIAVVVVVTYSYL